MTQHNGMKQCLRKKKQFSIKQNFLSVAKDITSYFQAQKSPLWLWDAVRFRLKLVSLSNIMKTPIKLNYEEEKTRLFTLVTQEELQRFDTPRAITKTAAKDSIKFFMQYVVYICTATRGHPTITSAQGVRGSGREKTDAQIAVGGA